MVNAAEIMRTDEMLQWARTGVRSHQGHATLCVSFFDGAFCQMAYNIGEDLFRLSDGNKVLLLWLNIRLKYNLWKDLDDTFFYIR